MSLKLFRFCFTLVSLAAFALPVFAQQSGGNIGVRREAIPIDQSFGVGARAMGMGGAHIAAAGDVSALYWNPANLVYIRRIELSTTLARESTEISTRYFDTPAEDSETSTRLSSIGLAYPIPTLRGSLVLAGSVNRVHSFEEAYRHEGYNPIRDGEFGDRFETETQTSSGGIYTWSLGGAIDVSQQLSLGLSLNIWDGNYEGFWRLKEEDTRNQWSDEIYYDVYETTQDDDFDLDAFNISFGGIYRVNRNLNIGFSVISKATIEFDGDELQQFYAYDEFRDEPYEQEYITYDDTEVPWTFGLGFAYTQRMFKIAFDAAYSDWSETVEDDPTTEFDEGSLYDEVLKLRLGGEVLIPQTPIRLRAGVYSDPLPYQGTEVDKDRIYLTGGIGFLLDRVFTVDLAYVTGSWERQNVTYDYRSETTSERIFVSGSYHF